MLLWNVFPPLLLLLPLLPWWISPGLHLPALLSVLTRIIPHCFWHFVGVSSCGFCRWYFWIRLRSPVRTYLLALLKYCELDLFHLQSGSPSFRHAHGTREREKRLAWSWWHQPAHILQLWLCFKKLFTFQHFEDSRTCCDLLRFVFVVCACVTLGNTQRW